MKTCIVIGLIALIGAAVFGGISILNGIKAGTFTSELRLAYAASTPQSKAQYVRSFIAKAESANLPEYAAWIVQRPENSVRMQLDILDGLAARCEQLATLDPSSFGFAQGMTQITQDEFEYTLSNTKAVFAKAFCIQYGWFSMYAWFIFLGIGVLFMCIVIAMVDNDMRF
ncbi:MAG: hypothetical protein M0R22_08555 [Dehalococcoidia bacterium]|jgi:hypothetical protein|nr:hypothetical protein [Dehalococcoidia bacterium]